MKTAAGGKPKKGTSSKDIITRSSRWIVFVAIIFRYLSTSKSKILHQQQLFVIIGRLCLSIKRKTFFQHSQSVSQWAHTPSESVVADREIKQLSSPGSAALPANQQVEQAGWLSSVVVTVAITTTAPAIRPSNCACHCVLDGGSTEAQANIERWLPPPAPALTKRA